jgi:hypothetical protein
VSPSPGEEHPAPGDRAHFGEAAGLVAPMVVGEDGIAASKEPSGKGRTSAEASTPGAAPGGRCARITVDGSTAVTSRSDGS